MGRVVGVGGLFLQFKGSKQEVQDWYEQNLGLPMSQYGSGFTQGEQLMLFSFSNDSEETPLVNLRVDDLDAVVATIAGQGADVGVISDYGIGRFVRFTDPFGNLIELWEPRADEYRAMVKAEIEAYHK